jgi:3-hydroxy acid dehydrogenase/malonic semialdehyde reductase
MPPLTSMSKNLHGKTILITGASSGIGRSTAFEFARTSSSNLRLILTARRIDRLHAISREILDEVGDGVKIYVQQLDVSVLEEVNELVQRLPEEFRDVDVLVNNAYVDAIENLMNMLRRTSGFMSGMEQPPDIPHDVIRDVYATNVVGVINMTQAILPIFKQRPDGGRGDVIFLGSIAGRDPYVGGTVYLSCSSFCRIYGADDSRYTVLVRQLYGPSATRLGGSLSTREFES